LPTCGHAAESYAVLMQKIVMPNGDSVLVEPWDEASAYRLENLGRFGAAGNAIWHAHLPENSGPDCFVAVREEDGLLVGTTWSGRSVTLDPDTGEEVRSTFVK
jgi:hypothetical protein